MDRERDGDIARARLGARANEREGVGERDGESESKKDILRTIDERERASEGWG